MDKIVAASMTAGVVGLWAFFGSNATAAKLYLWTWPPRYLIREATAFVYRAQLKTNIVSEGINLLVFLYYLKVSQRVFRCDACTPRDVSIHEGCTCTYAGSCSLRCTRKK